MRRHIVSLLLAALGPALALQVARPQLGCVQAVLQYTPSRRGYHLITEEVVEALGDQLSGFQHGMCHLFVQHMSCSLTINENSPPAAAGTEGDATSPRFNRADVPSNPELLGVSLEVPITSGALALGPWQGIYFCEHGEESSEGGTPMTSSIIITAHGQLATLLASTADPGSLNPRYRRPDEPGPPRTSRSPNAWPNWDLPFDRGAGSGV